ncbi:MAG: glycosyltransferase [Bacteroidota bacterium]
MILFLVISFSFLFLYLLLISGFYHHWKKACPFHFVKKEEIFISLVIPFFNEEVNLRSLVTSIKDQNYSRDRFEVILVDDHSTDSSLTLAKKLTDDDQNIRIIRNRGSKGKKYALRSGIIHASSEYILISDADCNFSKEWISTFASFFSQNPSVKLVSSGVVIKTDNNFKQAYQALEFSSLIATGAASFFENDPIMCNGANLAFTRKLFLEAFENMHPGINTGDDMFLMLYTKKNYPENYAFIKNLQSFTSTQSADSWAQFFRQRIRWASKSNVYRDKRLIYTAFVVLFTNLILLIFFILSFFDLSFLFYFLVYYFIKSIPDYLFLRNYLEFSRQRDLLKFFIPSQLVNMFFIPLTGISGIIISPNRN